jgi:hypothetical protein
MFRISPDLKREVERRSLESKSTITSYIEALIMSDIGENPRIFKKRRGLISRRKRI